MRERKPTWSSSSFLVYTGGLIVLWGGIGALVYLSHHYGAGAITGWALLVFVVLLARAEDVRRRKRPIEAGIFAFISVIAWAALLFFAWRWWGWNLVGGSFAHWSWSRLGLELLVLLAAIGARRRFRFPFIRLISAVVGWFFVIDLVTDGGDFAAAVTLVVGIAYLVGGSIDRRPGSFWLHLVGGLLIGGAVLYWWHTSDTEWAGVSVVALVYVAIAYLTKRSTWAVLGTAGFYAATVHYLTGSPTGIATGLAAGRAPSIGGWASPLAFGILGFWLVLLGILGHRRDGGSRTAAASPAE